MESLQLITSREIPLQQQNVESCTTSLRQALHSAHAKSQHSIQLQEEVVKVKAELRDAEDELVKALAAKTRKEAKRMALLDSVSDMKARVQELGNHVQELKTEKDEYKALMFKKSQEKGNRNSDERQGEIQESISWYNRVLGFNIECGHGVKFVFKNINLKDLYEEYSFSIRHANDTYTLLDCNPQLNETEKLVNELNQTNGLFKFVRVMREKFHEYAMQNKKALHQDLTTMSLSGPDFSASSAKSGSLGSSYRKVQHGVVNIEPQKAIYKRGTKAAILSPGLISSPRKSPRFKVTK